MAYGNVLPSVVESEKKAKGKNKLNLATDDYHSSPYLQNQSLPKNKPEIKLQNKNKSKDSVMSSRKSATESEKSYREMKVNSSVILDPIEKGSSPVVLEK